MGYIEKDLLIKSVDAGLLYWIIRDDNKIAEYEKNKKNIENIKKNIKDKKDEDSQEKLTELEKQREELSKDIFSFKGKVIEFKTGDNRYTYSGSLSDSLMTRQLRKVVAKDSNAIRPSLTGDYTDVIINISFNNDFMIGDGNKKAYNPDTDKIEKTDNKKMKKLISRKKLRKMAYEDGVTINDTHYVVFQRSSSKARTGNCLFIDEKYFQEMEAWQNFGIPFRDMAKSKNRKENKDNPFKVTDLVSSRAYASLTSSSIIGLIDIDPDKILLIDDVAGTGERDCNVIELEEVKKKVKDKKTGQEIEKVDASYLKCTKKLYRQTTDLWDGQSLADRSLFDEGKYYTLDENNKEVENSYKDKGFLLIRNHFFKSAIFNTNLRDYYKERNIDVVYDRFGDPIKASEAQLVTTKNSIKIFKFSDEIVYFLLSENEKQEIQEKMVSMGWDEKKAKEWAVWKWYRNKLKGDGNKSEKQPFGVCKYEKESKFGEKQQLWYQILCTLNFSEDDLKELVKPQLDEINLMRNYPAFFRRGLDFSATDQASTSMWRTLLSINDDVSRTRWYADFRRSRLQSMVKHIRMGKLQIKNSDFCVMVGNPYEMLRASAGDTIEDSILHGFECFNSRYHDKEELFGFRAPHICSGNSALLKNMYRDEWKWFNFTDRILVVNFWGDGAFLSPTFNGSDVDSDTAFIGNNPIILERVREVNEENMLVPINGLSTKAKMYEYTNEYMATVDGQLANDNIGKICNLARDLHCMYWHLKNTGTEEQKEKYLSMIYDDICILEVLSNVAIDSAKRQYPVNIAHEINRIRSRSYMTEQGAIIKDGTICFVEEGYRKNLSDEEVKRYNEYVNRRDNCVNDKEKEEQQKYIDNIVKTEKTCYVRPEFTYGLAKSGKNGKNKDKIYINTESPMDILGSIIDEGLVRANRTKYIDFTDILKPIPSGKKADYHRIDVIVDIAVKGIQELRKLSAKYDSEKISSEEFYESKKVIENDIINSLKYTPDGKTRKMNTWDINKLLRMCYDVHVKRDKHGKPIKDENDNVVMIDRRDKRIIGAIEGKQKKEKGFVNQFLQWVYVAFTKEFIDAIKINKGKISYIVEYDPDKHKFKKEPEIYDLDGRKYIIRYKDLSMV